MATRVFIVFLILISISACTSGDIPTEEPTSLIENNGSIISTPTTQTELTENTSQNIESSVAAQGNNGVTVAITWIYVDAYRLAFETHVSGVSAPIGYSLPCPVRKVSITDDQGYSYVNFENGHENSENLSVHCVYRIDSSSFVATYNFYHKRTSLLQANPSLTLSLGDFELYAEDGQRTLLPDLGTYQFNLSVLADEELTFIPDETVEKLGVKTTLNRIEINPTFTIADLCIEYEDRHGWYPNAALVINNEKIFANPELTSWTNYNPNADWYESFTPLRCYEFTFPIDLILNSILQTKNIEISLDSLEINIMDATTQDECENLINEIQNAHPGLAFVCHIDYRGGGYGFAFEIISVPFGMTLEGAQKIIDDGFKKIVTGPWVFSIELSDK